MSFNFPPPRMTKWWHLIGNEFRAFIELQQLKMWPPIEGCKIAPSCGRNWIPLNEVRFSLVVLNFKPQDSTIVSGVRKIKHTGHFYGVSGVAKWKWGSLLSVSGTKSLIIPYPQRSYETEMQWDRKIGHFSHLLIRINREKVGWKSENPFFDQVTTKEPKDFCLHFTWDRWWWSSG
jgi:hypothetical protein